MPAEERNVSFDSSPPAALPAPRRYKVDYVYCWHGLPAYWNGVMPGEPDMLPLQSRILFPKATPGVEEIEPSMAWNPAVLAGGCLSGCCCARCHLHSRWARAVLPGGVLVVLSWRWRGSARLVPPYPSVCASCLEVTC